MQDNIQLLKEKYSLSDEELQELDALIKSTQKLKDSNKIYNNKIRKTLKQYNWVIPYGMEYDELNFLLKETKSQKEFTNELLKYFTDDIINDIFDKIINMEIQQHIDIINQIRKSYFDNCFSLINCSIIALIDFNLMFYLKDKRNLKRQRLVSELAIKIGKESGYFLSKYELYIVLDFIKELFHPEDFNRIEFNQELLLNWHLSQHGFFSSNKKIDSILLLNILYYMLEFQQIFKKYENSIDWSIKDIQKP